MSLCGVDCVRNGSPGFGETRIVQMFMAAARRNYFQFSYLRHFHGHLLKAGYRLLTEKELQYTYTKNILTDNTMATIPVQFKFVL